MKFNRRYLGLCLICMLIVGCKKPVKQSDAVENAIQFLANNTASPFPKFEMGLVDLEKRKTAEQLISKQMHALALLKDNKDPSIIPMLIKYLNYTDDYSLTNDVIIHVTRERKPPPPPDIKELCKHFPAFAAIINTPEAGTSLAKYALNTNNLRNYRVTAFLVLRYIDQKKFKIVAVELDKEFAKADLEDSESRLLSPLRGIEDGRASFKGLVFIDNKIR